jgi:nuclear pore complex protein Nup93
MLLQLQDGKQFNEQILIQAARHSEENDQISEAKLYNLAKDIISCIGTRNTAVQPNVDDKGRVIERTVVDIL